MAENAEIVEDGKGPEADRAAIEEPGKLMRIAVMLRELQEEVRRAPTDEAGRERIRVVHEGAVEQLCSTLSTDLRDELTSLALPFSDDTPSESEILIAQAQLVGWLEGLFQGIQAAIMNQQLIARQQIEQMRQRGLPSGAVAQGGPEQGKPTAPGEPVPPTGQYL
jgi:hypothetical protein